VCVCAFVGQGHPTVPWAALIYPKLCLTQKASAKCRCRMLTVLDTLRKILHILYLLVLLDERVLGEDDLPKHKVHENKGVRVYICTLNACEYGIFLIIRRIKF